MKDLITSTLTEEELHDLTMNTIEYCSDGQIINEDNEVVSLTFNTDDSRYVELTRNSEIHINRDLDGLRHRILLTPDTLMSLFQLFESVTDHYHELKE